MQIYKFGGASVKTPDAFKNVLNIIKDKSNLVIVVSAIDKTTNRLENLVNSKFNNNNDTLLILSKIETFHFDFAKNAFGECFFNIENEINVIFNHIRELLSNELIQSYDELYDNIVCHGELLSSLFLSHYLKLHDINNTLLDIREVLVTDSNFRDAKVLWQESEAPIKSHFTGSGICVTQGFIGKDKLGNNTTLGREGSDYTASALAFLLDADSVTIWKDVPGIMNADPIWCNFAEKIDFLSFREAIELAFYGAKIIHPKTIKPIENKNIPLYVKPFNNPQESGTVIKKLDYKLELMPIYIRKSNQILISVSPKDFSFVVEENISKLFGLFAKYKAKVNITQNSAISFSASLDGNNRNFDKLISDLKKEYKVRYNTGLEMITIRYYNEDSITKMITGKQVMLEQRSRTTARFVLA